MQSGSRAADPATARVVVTGTEVLEGRVRDEDGPFVAGALAGAGLDVREITVVGDALDDIRAVLARALSAAPDMLVVTGGLGPTHDDRTMEAVALATGRPLRVHAEALALVRGALAPVPARASAAMREEGARKQAALPDGATMLPPPGTAPGAVLVSGGTVLAVLPGPPWECRAAWDAARQVPEVARVLARRGTGAPLAVRMSGVVESEFMEAMARTAPEDRGLVVGVCARPGELEVTVRPAGPGAEAFVAVLDREFPGAVFSRDGSRVEEVLGALLAREGLTLGTAESCTGGMIGARLTAVPGSSAWFAGGVVAYSDVVKAGLLGVPAHLLARHGAVSEPVAAAMADGTRASIGCDWAVSVTGIAGPGGGSPAKPVGLVFVGVAGPCGVSVRELRLPGDRDRVRMRASTIALHMAREALGA